MKLSHVLQYAGFLVGLVVLNGLLTMDTKTTASIIASVAIGIYCLVIGTVTVVRGLR